MSWVDAARYAQAEPDPLVDASAGIIEHMNDDHADAQLLYCRYLLDRPDTTEASMSAVDRYGFEMIAVSPAGRVAVRIGFPDECRTGEEVRKAMVALVAEARARASSSAGR
jgi:putative heme iron utilization protein